MVTIQRMNPKILTNVQHRFLQMSAKTISSPSTSMFNHNGLQQRTCSSSTTENAESLVKSAIKSNKVVMFSRIGCPFCNRAKSLLFDELGVSRKCTNVIEVNELSNGQEVKQVLKHITGAATVPRLFVAEQFVGGASEAFELAESGELQKLLNSAGAL